VPLPESVEATAADVELLRGIFDAIVALRFGPTRAGEQVVQALTADGWDVRAHLGWVAEADAGGSPAIPAPGHTWRTTPALNEELRLRARTDGWDAVVARFARSHGQVRTLIAGSGDDLFDKRVVRWTGSTSVGAYAVSATSSHYAWALDLVRRFRKDLEPGRQG